MLNVLWFMVPGANPIPVHNMFWDCSRTSIHNVLVRDVFVNHDTRTRFHHYPERLLDQCVTPPSPLCPPMYTSHSHTTPGMYVALGHMFYDIFRTRVHLPEQNKNCYASTRTIGEIVRPSQHACAWVHVEVELTSRDRIDPGIAPFLELHPGTPSMLELYLGLHLSILTFPGVGAGWRLNEVA